MTADYSYRVFSLSTKQYLWTRQRAIFSCSRKLSIFGIIVEDTKCWELGPKAFLWYQVSGHERVNPALKQALITTTAAAEPITTTTTILLLLSVSFRWRKWGKPGKNYGRGKWVGSDILRCWRRRVQGAEGAKNRDAKGVERRGEECGGGIPLPSQLEGLHGSVVISSPAVPGGNDFSAFTVRCCSVCRKLMSC